LAHTKLWIIAMLALQLALPCGAALAGDVVVGAGSKSGYYYSVARGLLAVLSSEHRIRPELRESAGSVENLQALDSDESPVNVAFAQADALHAYIQEHPGFAEEIAEIEDVGLECVYFIASRTGDLQTAADLKTGRDKKIAIGDAGSGAGITWQIIQSLDPAYRKTQATDTGYIEGLLELNRTASTPQVDTVMMVHRPRNTPTAMEVVLGQREKFKLLPIEAADLARTSFDPKTPIYTFEEVQVGFGAGGSARVKTACTRGLLLASKKKLDKEDLAAITQAMASSRDFIAPGTR
jgi:TRAP-type uncharacterized transport system substrate-binding protein